MQGLAKGCSLEGIVRGDRGRGLTVWGTKTQQEKEHAGECETRRYTQPDVANVIAPRTTTRRVREDQVYPVTQETQESGTRAHDLSFRAWLSPWSHPVEANTYITAGFQEWISHGFQSHQIRSPCAQSDFTGLILNNTLTRIFCCVEPLYAHETQ